MGILQVLNDAPGYLKATFQGPQGSGKTHTAARTAIVVHRHFNSKKPIAFLDTEKGSDYIAEMLEKGTGRKPLRAKTRAFSDLIGVVKECESGEADILIVDSITHFWREIQEAYMVAVNRNRTYPKKRMDIQDIMQVKQQWAAWPDLFLNSNVHIICCGREGNEWGHEENEDGKKELVTTGKKMKVEGEFGYEASLMVSMKGIQVPATTIKAKNGSKERRPTTILNVATVLKDRFDLMNGQEFEMPTGEEFMPFIERLRPASEGRVDMSVKSDGNMNEGGESDFHREKRDREILREEIQGEMVRVYPGTTNKEKEAKLALIELAFQTRSWTKVETFGTETLRKGLAIIREQIQKMPRTDAATDKAD